MGGSPPILRQLALAKTSTGLRQRSRIRTPRHLKRSLFKWKSNLAQTKTALSPPPPKAQNTETKPHIFYPIASAHLSQSDFGPLFPWLTKKVFKADSPDRTLRLNVRAILESLRRSGLKVADTSTADMEEELGGGGAREVEEKQRFPLGQDYRILAADGSVRGWISIPLDGDEEGGEGSKGVNGHAVEAENPGEAVMEGEVMKE